LYFVEVERRTFGVGEIVSATLEEFRRRRSASEASLSIISRGLERVGKKSPARRQGKIRQFGKNRTGLSKD
jgi:hypothetical protein